jgi:hypothetical protein
VGGRQVAVSVLDNNMSIITTRTTTSSTAPTTACVAPTIRCVRLGAVPNLNHRHPFCPLVANNMPTIQARTLSTMLLLLLPTNINKSTTYLLKNK